MKTKIKSNGDEVANFYDKEILKVDSKHIFLAVITVDSTLNKDGNYYLQVFLQECIYIQKNVISDIIDNSESSSDYFNDFD